MAKTIDIDGQLDFFDMLFGELPVSELSEFEECINCWCRDCKHNSRNEGEPREFGSEMKPCPACDSCIVNDEPEICEIGSYKNGCKLRAKEEGLAPDESI